MQLLGSIAALGALAAALPVPWMATDLVQGQQAGRAVADIGDTAMLLAASAAVWLLLLWAFVAAGAALASRFPGTVGQRGRTILARVAPAAARRVLLAAVGASMVTGVAACAAGPASMTPAGHGTPSAGSASGATQVDDSRVDGQSVIGQSVIGGRVASWTTVAGSAVQLRPAAVAVPPAPATLDIDWPAENPTRSPASVPVVRDGPVTRGGKPDAPVDIDWPGRTTAGSVVVMRGDTLWSIAARHLRPSATPDDIDRAWHQWFSANAAVIGTDPNLILPGQILLPPNPGTGN